MNLTDSLKLLRAYADRGDEAAFRELVERYIDLVYSAAVRRVGGDADLARDVTQTVFTDLARKGRSLRNVEFLGGWLHRHTGFVAASMARSEHRRQVREQEAAQMNTLNNSPDALWQQLAPVLDETIETLEPLDRQAILLRFYERRDFRSIGNALGISDDAAQKRVSRALEKLRELLTHRSIMLDLALLTALMSGRVVRAAPSGLAATVASLALAGASVGGTLTLTNLIHSLLFKVSIVGILVAGAVWLLRSNHSPRIQHPMQRAKPVLAATTPATTTRLPAQEPMGTPVAPAEVESVPSNELVLTIVAADTGQPVSNVTLDHLLWIKGKSAHEKPILASRSGICVVPVPDHTSELELISLRDGFATTRLDWRPDRWEQIPRRYTLRLARAVPIGGQVVGPDGNPVSGAKVSIDIHAPVPRTLPQSDDFPFPFTATTDAQGQWQIDRIGKQAVKIMNGNASYPDYVPSSTTFPDFNAIAEKQLLSGQFVFILRQAVVVRGLVTSPDGQPVPDANVLIGQGPGEIGARKTKTRSNGTFSVAGCQPGKNLITADAKGYASKSVRVELSDTNCGPFKISLAQGRVLKLRVMNEDGNPVPQAHVTLQFFPDVLYSGNSEPTIPPVRFNRQTDAEGRLEWDSAPDKELRFIVGAPGYMVKRGIKVQPDGIEHVITLQRALTVSGTVKDAITGKPIPQFRVIAGWPTELTSSNGTVQQYPTRPHWSSFERDWKSFWGGKFQFSYQSSMVFGEPNPGYMFKFEANGYEPYVTRVVRPTEQSVHFEVLLTPAATMKVTVLLPNQQPAAGVQIGLVAQDAGLILIPGGFSRWGTGSAMATALRTTDNQGQFKLPPDPAITEVVAASPQGYAEATPANLANNPVINLAPWGRLEGTLVTKGQPMAGLTLSIGFRKIGTLDDAISCGFPHFQAQTDDQGRFVFTQVPTGEHEITLVRPFTGQRGRGWAQFNLQPVTISPGATTTVTIETTNLFVPVFFRKGMGIDGPN